MDSYYEAVSLFRRRKYDQCVDVCNTLLQKNPTHRGPWELKMRAMTLRVYVDDIESNDGVPDEDDDLDTNRLATAPRPGTSLRTAATTAQNRSDMRTAGGRPRSSTGRALTGMSRPGTTSQRPGSSMKSSTALRSGTRGDSARNIRLGSASMFALDDPTGPLFQSSRMNPATFAQKHHVTKSLFQYLFYHEGDVRKALDLCEAVAKLKGSQTEWWWHTQRGRCLITMANPRGAEVFLRVSLNQFAHPDTVLLLARVYIKLDQPMAAFEVCTQALERLPNEVGLLVQQARLFELLNNLTASARMYRDVAQLEAMNTEALACIAVHHFYGNQPEIALLYYRRILCIGANTCELYCNLALCCLYCGQLELVLPCFQRALRQATLPEQRADVWYNLSFVAISSGDFNLARRCLRLCISSDASHGAALNNLAVLASRSGHKVKAQTFIAAAKNVLPQCEEVQHNFGILKTATTTATTSTAAATPGGKNT